MEAIKWQWCNGMLYRILQQYVDDKTYLGSKLSSYNIVKRCLAWKCDTVARSQAIEISNFKFLHYHKRYLLLAPENVKLNKNKKERPERKKRTVKIKGTLKEHWAGKECCRVVLEGSLVLAGILEGARAAWEAMFGCNQL